MKLQLSNVLPIPLRDKPSIQNSDVWLKELMYTKCEYISILAPSGTGKSTLMHALYGLRKDVSGSIKWDEQNILHIADEALAVLRAQHISIIFQDLRLFPTLTAWENIIIKNTLTQFIQEEEIIQWMKRLGIADKKNALAATLSYGEQQRVAIIRALVQPFDFLLMDEPFSHLDKENKAIAAALILEQVQRNKASLLIADLDENTYFPYHKIHKL
jgi:ABC-type lipoprotein export system ATPase subunit